MKNRLSKILQGAGVASRRAAEELIFEGRVSVNGAIVKVPQTLVDPSVDRIVFDGERIKSAEKKVYYLLNKPVGFLCSATGKSKKVLDLFADIPLRLFTVGRLDRDTSGLLIVTNDGHFANQVIHPSFNVTKEYLAKTDQEIHADHLQALSKGCYIEGGFVKPVSVTKVRRGTVKVVVREGKKHEVRIMLESAGLTIQTLTRIRIGPLTLGTLPVGARRALTRAEIDSFSPSQSL